MGILNESHRASGPVQRPKENPGGVTHHESLQRNENDLPVGTEVDPPPRLRAGGRGDSSPNEKEDLLERCGFLMRNRRSALVASSTVFWSEQKRLACSE